MTTTCDPGVGLFRAMEDAGELCDRLTERGENIHRELLVDGRWAKYHKIKINVAERTLDEIGINAQELLSALYWLNSCHNPKRKERAELWLADLGTRLEEILNEEIDEEIDRQDQYYIKYGEY